VFLPAARAAAQGADRYSRTVPASVHWCRMDAGIKPSAGPVSTLQTDHEAIAVQRPGWRPGVAVSSQLSSADVTISEKNGCSRSIAMFCLNQAMSTCRDHPCQ
jgi:hypothetical protein